MAWLEDPPGGLRSLQPTGRRGWRRLRRRAYFVALHLNLGGYTATTHRFRSMKRSAVISRDGKYRYALRRIWDPRKPAVLFVGLNPSTADHRVDDRTIRRCIGFAQAWGFGQLFVANLFAYRTPFPSALRNVDNPVGPYNDRWLRRLANEAKVVVAAWGNHGSYLGRDRDALPLLGRPMCLAMSKRGQPKHPLYIPASAKLRDLAPPKER